MRYWSPPKLEDLVMDPDTQGGHFFSQVDVAASTATSGCRGADDTDGNYGRC